MAECPLCLDPVRNACRTPCNHVFCRSCILKALQASPPEWLGACPYCRAHISVYNLRDEGGSVLAESATTTLYGTIFVQSGGLGVASYHFDAEDDCYISYENAPPQWGRLEDGSPIPTKKPFTDCSYDPEARTFRGVIQWSPTWNGMDRWDYQIVFSEEFVGVVGGGVTMHFVDGRSGQHQFRAPWQSEFDRGLAYLRWTPPPTTIFGSVYVQGLFYASLLEGIASYHFQSEDDCYISYSNAPSDWLLEDGTAPPQKKQFRDPSFNADTRTFQGDIDWPVPFGGDARWHYVMVFAEDFGSIVAGHLEAFGPDGAPREGTRFVNPAERSLLRDGMSYVQKPGALTSHAQVLATINATLDDEE